MDSREGQARRLSRPSAQPGGKEGREGRGGEGRKEEGREERERETVKVRV